MGSCEMKQEETHVVTLISSGGHEAAAGIDGAFPKATSSRSTNSSSVFSMPSCCFHTPGFATCGMNLCK